MCNEPGTWPSHPVLVVARIDKDGAPEREVVDDALRRHGVLAPDRIARRAVRVDAARQDPANPPIPGPFEHEGQVERLDVGPGDGDRPRLPAHRGQRAKRGARLRPPGH